MLPAGPRRRPQGRAPVAAVLPRSRRSLPPPPPRRRSSRPGPSPRSPPAVTARRGPAGGPVGAHRAGAPPTARTAASAGAAAPEPIVPLAALERQAIQRALEACGSPADAAETARHLGGDDVPAHQGVRTPRGRCAAGRVRAAARKHGAGSGRVLRRRGGRDRHRRERTGDASAAGGVRRREHARPGARHARPGARHARPPPRPPRTPASSAGRDPQRVHQRLHGADAEREVAGRRASHARRPR